MGDARGTPNVFFFPFPPCMKDTPPLALPATWDAVAEGYADELMPLFERYAQDALALAVLPARAHVLDVATGPGTLALLAAPVAERVVALDFSEAMIVQLDRRVAAARLAT